MRTVRFEAPVYIAELHPFNQYISLSFPLCVCMFNALTGKIAQLIIRGITVRGAAGSCGHILGETD